MIQKKTRALLQCIAILIIFMISSTAFADVPVNIFKSGHQGALTLKSGAIQSIINDTFDLSEEEHYKVNVKVIYQTSGTPDYLIVYLLSSMTYSYETTRVDLDDSYGVVSVTEQYKETDVDFSQGSVDVYKGTCPDSSIEMVFSTCETGIPTAVKGVDTAAKIAQDSGYAVKVLKGNAENTTAILNWLSCDNLVFFGRIGHGLNTGIMLADGTLGYNDFQNMPSGHLNGKVLYFNSCQVHNSPLQPSIVNAGVQKFIGGIENLEIGPSEEVFKCTIKETVENKAALTSSLHSCEQANYPYTGHHGISGNGSDYVEGDQTPGPRADFTFTVGGNGTQIYFTDTSTNTAGNTNTQWNWTFGDGSGSIQKNPTHTYSGSGTYSVTLTVTDDDNLTDTVTKTIVVDITELIGNCSPVANISQSSKQWRYYRINVPASADELFITTAEGSGDADLYVKYGSKPTTENSDYKSTSPDSYESCTITNPQAGVWYVGVHAWNDISGITLEACYQPDDNNTAPVVNAGADLSISKDGTATLNGTVTDDGLPTPPGSLTVQWTKQSGPGNVSFSDSGSAATTATFTETGSYILQLTANDSVLSASDTVSVTVTESPDQNYCELTGGSQDYEYIGIVKIGSFTHSTGASGYSDFTSKIIDAEPSESLTVTLTPVFLSGAYTEHWFVWVDLNRDNDFDDNGEQVFQASGNSDVTGTITIPEGTASGRTRLRVAMSYSGDVDACGEFSFGEVEDYTLSIADGGSNPGQYCESKSTTQSYEHIAGVMIDSFTNTSGASPYTDYTAREIGIGKGVAASVTLTPGFESGAYQEYWRLWADLNQDNDFQDSGEMLFEGFGNSDVIGTVTIPDSALNGVTRLRVSMKYNGYPEPCETIPYGEVEDYSLRISDDDGPGPGTGLSNGETVETISIAREEWLYKTITVPDGSTNLVIRTINGTGDVDLYVRLGDNPTSDTFDEKATSSGNSEIIKIAEPTAGTYHIGLFGYSNSDSFNLTASFINGTQHTVSVEQAYSLINQNSGNGNFVILDVRTPAEFDTAQIEHAENMDFYCTSFHGKFKALDKNKRYLVVCKTQNRSSQTAMMMKENGFTDFQFMAGGMTEWIDKGYPVIEGDGDGGGG